MMTYRILRSLRRALRHDSASLTVHLLRKPFSGGSVDVEEPDVVGGWELGLEVSRHLVALVVGWLLVRWQVCGGGNENKPFVLDQ